MTKVFECEKDGVVIRGEDDDELVESVERHAADVHPDLVGKLSRDQILAIAKEA
jgi:predicted small metal-binding protein